MTKDAPPVLRQAVSPASWSNRILLLALAGILFLTFYPFRFAPRALPLRHATPFLLGGLRKSGRELWDATLNVLLFVPFGFGVSEKSRDRGWTWKRTFFAACVSGFLVSYSIEFLQQYTPTRESRWEDVCSNTTGAIAGFLLFSFCGMWLVKWASKAERSLRPWLTLRRVAVLIPICFILWFGYSVALQKETRFLRVVTEPRSLARAKPGVAYELGPGAALASRIRQTNAAELEGYEMIYDALIFVPAGALFGMALIAVGPRDIAASVALAVEFVLPPWLLARILSYLTGRPVSVRSIFLCLILAVAGGMWINTDCPSAAAAAAE